MSERHTAPRRQVQRIVRTDGYGTTRYHHLLDCGHTEVRRRRSPAPTMGCPRCGQDADLQRLLVELDDSAPSHSELVSDEASIEVEIARLKAGLAGLLAVDLEDVSMQLSVDERGTRLQGAYVWISGDSLMALRPTLLGPTPCKTM